MSDGAPEKVLVIEDDRFLSSVLKNRFEKDGIQVMQAFNGEEALEVLHTERPSLILLDIIMPRMSGFDVLKAISVDPQLAGIPVVIVSNLAQEEDVQKAKGLGAVDYFVKVRVSIDELIERAKVLMSGAGSSAPQQVQQ